MAQFEPAIAYCQKSLAYDKSDPYTHYALALCYMHQAQSTGSLETLSAAQAHFLQKMIEINPDLSKRNSPRPICGASIRLVHGGST